jgi:antitoxin component YwqK of YwqJK toxin-antitoxin module
MKMKVMLVLGAVSILMAGCRNSNEEDNVVSQRYIHKYGYAVSKEEWDAKNYPGQVITTLRNGITVTATYENGVLHGPSTYTYPHSQTVEAYLVYNHGNLVKEMKYDNKGMPSNEKAWFSPSRYTLTLWYTEGSPLSIEEYSNEELMEGRYFTLSNETEGRVEKGNGLRVVRNQQGILVSKDVIEGGFIAKREAFYPNGSPESVTHYSRGQLHGEKKLFAQSGEPTLIEEWVNGKLHGKCTYFNNGTKEVEISYLNGLKNGQEIHYIDGAQILEETLWENGKKHGASTFYISGEAKTSWFYDGKQVSVKRFEELARLDEMISQISSDVQAPSGRR